jgi:hypothetical protein
MTTVVEHRARRNRGRVASPAPPRWRLTSRWLRWEPPSSCSPAGSARCGCRNPRLDRRGRGHSDAPDPGRAGRVELGVVVRQPLRPDLRPHLLQLLNYTLLAALILIAGALGTFTNLPLYAGILLPQFDQISGHQAAVQLAALALAALALVPARRVRPIPHLAVLSFSLFLASSWRPPSPAEGCSGVIDLPLAGSGRWWLAAAAGC